MLSVSGKWNATKTLHASSSGKPACIIEGATMTPTEQDKELREALMRSLEAKIMESGFLDEHDKNVGGTLYTPANNQKLTASALADVLSVDIMQLITADRKRVALEARIDELENRLRVQFIPSHWARLCAEVNSWAKYVDRRIAELKAQQEELLK